MDETNKASHPDDVASALWAEGMIAEDRARRQRARELDRAYDRALAASRAEGMLDSRWYVM